MRTALLLALLLGVSALSTAAQSETPGVTPAAEYNIGFDCPIAQALSPDGAVLWVLMQGCFSRAYSLQAFSVADGAPVDAGSDYSEALEPLRAGYVDSFTNPMAFTPEGVLSIHYVDNETFQPRSLTISLEGEAATPLISDEALADLLSSYTDYPETTVFSADHAQAAVVGVAELHVLDLTTGEERFSLSTGPAEYNAFPSFSADGQTLYLAQLDAPDDMNDYSATLSAYHLPDGAPLDSAAMPSPFAWISPDGRYAAALLGSNDNTAADLFVVDLASGGQTEPFPLYEPPSRVLACANDGRNMSDVDFTASGRLNLTSVSWLPDSSAFVFTRSYGGESAGGARPCAFNYSRLNRFDVNAGS